MKPTIIRVWYWKTYCNFNSLKMLNFQMRIFIMDHCVLKPKYFNTNMNLVDFYYNNKPKRINLNHIWISEWVWIICADLYQIEANQNWKGKEFAKSLFRFKLWPEPFLTKLRNTWQLMAMLWNIALLEIKPCGHGSRIRDMEAESYNWSHLLVNI